MFSGLELHSLQKGMCQRGVRRVAAGGRAAGSRRAAGGVGHTVARPKNLAGFKVPGRVDFLDELPREDSGKIFKRKLRDPYWAGAGRTI